MKDKNTQVLLSGLFCPLLLALRLFPLHIRTQKTEDMAIQFIQQPGAVSFSGDPIIAKVKTTLSGKTFLRVQAKCAVTVYRDGESYDYAENFSYEVGSDGVAVFSVNDTIKTAFGIYASQEVTSAGIQQTLLPQNIS